MNDIIPHLQIMPVLWWFSPLRSIQDGKTISEYGELIHFFNEFPPLFISSNLSFLTILHISNNNQLISLPDSIGNLSSLILLNISNNNQLISLPDFIENLFLIHLWISYNNQLISLPDSIGKLFSLTKLWISNNNKLILLPDSIA